VKEGSSTLKMKAAGVDLCDKERRLEDKEEEFAIQGEDGCLVRERNVAEL
jgi:hypothetical protein